MPVGPEFLAQGKGKPTSALPLQSRGRAEFHRQSEPRVHQTACTKSESDVPAESGRPKRRRRVGWQIWVQSRVEIDELPRSPAMKLCSGDHRTGPFSVCWLLTVARAAAIRLGLWGSHKP